jgi:hypothetical protein
MDGRLIYNEVEIIWIRSNVRYCPGISLEGSTVKTAGLRGEIQIQEVPNTNTIYQIPMPTKVMTIAHNDKKN